MFVPARTSCVRAKIVSLPPGLPGVVVVAISLRALVISPFPFVDIAKLHTKKGRQKNSVAQWEFMGVSMGVLAVSLSSWEFS